MGRITPGKSNILSAIDAFFHSIPPGQVFGRESPIGRSTDFFGSKEDEPIELTLVFFLTLADRDELLRNIVSEAPQLKNAVDGLDPSLRLAVTISFPPKSNNLAYVSNLILVPKGRYDGDGNGQSKLLLSISRDTAQDLYSATVKTEGASQAISAVERIGQMFDEDSWRMVAGREPEGRSRNRLPVYLLRELPPAVQNDQRLRQKIEAAASQDDYMGFRRALESITLEMRAEQEAAQQSNLQTTVRTFAGEESRVPAYALNLLHNIFSINVMYLSERRRPVGKDEAQRLLSLKVRRGGPEVLRNIQDTVLGLIGVQVDAFESNASGREPSAEMDVDNFLVEVNGSGIREALRLLLDVEFVNPTIVFVEEPEVHLHPALEISMMRYLKQTSSRCQVFLSTHSTNFVDTGEMNNIYLVSKSDSTNVQLVNVDEAEAEIPKELGIRLSSVFMFDRLIFVEGPSDEAVLREWASILGINFAKENVGFVSMGGVKNFTHYAAASTLHFLARRQVRMWFLLDKDERDDSEVERLIALCAGKATAHILKRRELENYLLSERALAAFINEKRRLGGYPADEDVTPQDVAEALSHTADQLREFTVRKRMARLTCKPVYPDY